ncbi:indolepyruvate ferredoxin oxidoreductase family protein [Sphingomonas sp. GB1N7]|uniref:indolepyruvate ferredoxin oxidoreductase family protein n=1 Tax=Parasphingomonas caseinilytica TaxID=3096158 RepID=UPI002FCB4889
MTDVASFDKTVTLADKYVRSEGRVFLSGTQALVRLPLLQRARDKAHGLNTGGFISGYRGSPLANYDTALWAAKKELDANGIVFQPGLNEELAATSVWGTQQVALRPEATVDGVFAIWYGKGPGVDRSMDALKHANAAGTSSLGGVLAIFGDDHGAQSSTMLHQSEQLMEAAFIPVLNPADVEEHVTFGLHGFALSRFAGCWVGLKATTEVVESSASIDASEVPLPVIPSDFTLPPGGLGIRWPDTAVAQERRMLGDRMAAIAAFARANRIDRQELEHGPARLGIATTGKAYGDVRQALAELGIGNKEATALGLRLYKFGMTWPIEVEGLRRFADGLEEVFVVEEKRAFLEPQILSALRGVEGAPRVVGKTVADDAPLLPSHGELTPAIVAAALVTRLRTLGADVSVLEPRLNALRDAAAPVLPIALARTPFFCSGCPHSSSTKLPEGSRALAGTGCHSMSMYIPDRNAAFLTQMGGEGVNWIGQAPFVSEKHVFVNLGDGTFSHSGLLAIRAAAASGVNATYKILYNDAVAMTGGQENDAHLTVQRIAMSVKAEGAKRVVVLSERPERFNAGDMPSGVELLERGELERIQRELRELPGLTVLIFDQVCAAEKRRRRKRKQYPAAPKRVFINDAVCEACGDCSVQSNCISVAPVETPLGRKRAIDQSSCNADYSCVKGFCPSFVTVEGAVPRKEKASADHLDAEIARLPQPTLPALERPYNLLTTGVGGTGVITVGAILGMAAHLEGKAVTTLDFTGLAQKNGAVASHIRIARDPAELGPTRMIEGSADVVLACDVVVAASAPALSRMGRTRTRVVANTHVQPPGAFVLDTSIDLSSAPALAAIRRAVGDCIDIIDGSRIAVKVMGDTIYANLFMLGLAWQKGLVPIGLPALSRAIELNGAAVHANKRAFALGRLAAVRPESFDFATDDARAVRVPALSTDELIRDRHARLADYQNEAYAARFDRLVGAVATAERRLGGEHGLTAAVARNFYRLMAYKDEYEVARLYTDGTFQRKLDEALEGGGRREIHLSPPLFARCDPVTGHPRKVAFGPWIFIAFGVLSKLKGLRGTPFDPFGYTAERRRERALIDQYESDMLHTIQQLTIGNTSAALALAELPDGIRGFGHVKDRNMDAANSTRVALLATLDAPARQPTAADIREEEIA